MAAPAAPAKSTTTPQFASLYVGDLNADVTEAMLYEIFNAVGPVGSIRVCRDRVTRRSLGYAYINFHNVTDAERALDTLNYSQIKGRSCRLMWSQRDAAVRKSGVGNIYVKNIDENIDNKALYDTFSLFGNILSCKVASFPDGKSKGYGFVQFETDENAAAAVERVNGMKIGEQVVEVLPYEKQEEKKKEEGFKNLYIKSFPNEWDDDKLKEVFGPYGEITAVAVKKDWKDRPFGFVDFANIPDAQKCVEELHLKEMRTPEQKDADEKAGKKMEKDQEGHPLHLLYVGRMQSKAEREKAWKEKNGESGKAGKGGKGGWKGGGGWGNNSWGSSSWGKGGGGKPGMMPMMPMGVKGQPMVANPQQMMAMMQMSGFMGKGGYPMMGKGMDMMGKGGPPGGKGGKGGGMKQGPPPMGAGNQKLTAAMLLDAPPAVQKQMIGERLFRAVAKHEADLAAKITGMMLEMDNSELLMLLESEARLKRQIDQAVGVLRP